MIRFLFPILFLFTVNFSKAQNIDWINSFGTENGSARCQTISITSISENKNYALVNISNTYPTFKEDTIQFGLQKFYKPADTNYSQNYIVEFNKLGDVINAKALGNTAILEMISDTWGNIYILGNFNDTLKYKLINDSLDKSKGRIYIAKIDSNLNTVWINQYGNDTLSGAHKIYNYDNSIYFIMGASGIVKLGNKTYYLNNQTSFIYIKVNPLNGQVNWSDCPLISDNFSNVFLSDLTVSKGKIYLIGSITGNSKIYQSDTFFSPGSFIIKLDTNHNYINRFAISNTKWLEFSTIATDKDRLFIGGSYQDSLKWGTQWQYSSVLPNLKNNKNLFIASISTSFEPQWFYSPIITDFDNKLNHTRFVQFYNGFVYWGGFFNNSLNINNSSFEPSYFSRNFFIIKTDPIGNILWTSGTRTSNEQGLLNTLKVNKTNSIFAGGYFLDSLKLGKFIHTFKNSNLNSAAFITKITDYDITRGKVKSGPYCAGDTILVPYTHIGNFDTSNYFIAELSDEKGEFIGKQRELGRLKTNLDSAVKGILPDFEVSTSGNYRIRIRSTAPAIQSYFILDSLRLLIYSRDKADPGPADTICFMDTLQLNTFGGTKWTWSPAYFMDDATKRQPNIWPDKDTTYKIVIADSSGCGLADTAYKKVVVKPKPSLVGDTLVYKCFDVNLKLKVNVVNSTLGHTVKWFRNNKLFFTNDSMIYVLDESSTFIAVLFDDCSPVTDTLVVKVIYQNPSQLKTIADTAVCFGSQVTLKANATVNNGFSKFSWFTSSGQFIGNGTPIVTLNKTDSFKIVLADNCNLKADSAWYKISLNGQIHPLQNLLPNDTILCDAATLKLSLYNASSNDSIVWKDWQSNQILSTNKEYQVTNPIHLKAEVRNICGVTSDSLIVSYLTKPNPLLDSIYNPCQGSALPLSVGQPNNQEKYLWSNNATTATTSYNQSGNHWVQVSNNCGTAFQYFKIDFATKPKAAFNNSDVCEGQAFMLNNQSTQATGISYNWRLGDGTLDSGFAPVHTYKKTGNARTFLVSLLVASSKDCADSITLPINVNITPDASFDAAAQNKTVFFTPKNIDNQNTYKWYFGDGDSSNTKQPNHTYKADSGTYTVCLTLTNNSNCSSTFCQEVHFSVGINNLKAQGIAIYPNPTSGELTIEFSSQSANISIFLYNTLGQQVFEKHHLSSKQSLDISHLNKGVYWVNLVVDGVVWSSKVVVY